jgi:hypothetical protein
MRPEQIINHWIMARAQVVHLRSRSRRVPWAKLRARTRERFMSAARAGIEPILLRITRNDRANQPAHAI